MKKTLIVILSMMFVLGLTISAFAVHEEAPSETAAVAKGGTKITLGGELRVRGEYLDNTDFDENDADSKAAYDQRLRLSLDAQITPNTQGYIQLESNGGTSLDVDDLSITIDNDSSDTYTWGNYSAAKGNNGNGLGNAKRGDLRILQAWIQHTGSGLLGVPAGMKIGHMPIKFGRGLFLDHSKFGDDALLLFADPTSELHAVLGTIKLNENSTTQADDDNGFALLMDYKGAGFNVGGDVTYVDGQALAPEGLHFWNFALRGDTSVAGANIYADVEIQTGALKKVMDDDSDFKLKGYAWMLGASMDLDQVTLGLEGAYGSGDKVDEDGDTGSKDESFLTTLGADQHYSYIYEYKATSAANGVVGSTGTATGLANTWYIKASASAKPMPDLTAGLSLYYLRASKAVAINGATNTDGSEKKSKNLGFEVDGKVTYQIDRNLVYTVEGGYLFAGGAYDNGTSVDGTNNSSDNVWGVRHGVTLSF